jgi:hypothetical protein
MLNIRLYKDKNGNSICLFTCDHQRPPRAAMNDQACRPTIAGGNVYRCAMELRHQDPKTNPSVGCIGGYKMCMACDDVAGKFIDASHDAQAMRKEWEID